MTTVSTGLMHAIINTWNQIFWDVPDVTDNEEAVELCIDAHRLKTYGYPEAQAEVTTLVHELGYPKALHEIASTIRLT